MITTYIYKKCISPNIQITDKDKCYEHVIYTFTVRCWLHFRQLIWECCICISLQNVNTDVIILNRITNQTSLVSSG